MLISDLVDQFEAIEIIDAKQQIWEMTSIIKGVDGEQRIWEAKCVNPLTSF